MFQSKPLLLEISMPISMMEDLISANDVELLYEKENPPTYLHYNGSTTNPDLMLVLHLLQETLLMIQHVDTG
jgi:hypothetical protein